MVDQTAYGASRSADQGAAPTTDDGSRPGPDSGANDGSGYRFSSGVLLIHPSDSAAEGWIRKGGA